MQRHDEEQTAGRGLTWAYISGMETRESIWRTVEYFKNKLTLLLGCLENRIKLLQSEVNRKIMETGPTNEAYFDQVASRNCSQCGRAGKGTRLLLSKPRAVSPRLTVMLLAASSYIFAQGFSPCGTNICASTGANVGIGGTTNPTSTLYVNGTSVTRIVSATDSDANQATVQAVDNTTTNNLVATRINPIHSANLGFNNIPLSGFVGTSTGSTGGLMIGAQALNAPVVFFNNFNGNGAAFSTERMRIAGNGNIGIGTTSPANRLEVAGNYNAGNPVVAAKFGAAGFGGTAGDRADLLLGNVGGADFGRIDLFATGSADLAMNFGVWNGASIADILTLKKAGTVGIGTTVPCTTNAPANCILSVNGAIQAKEVVVNTGWPDYVFDPNYHLAPLSDVAKYITANHRLPDVPSAQQVEQKGVSLGEMQSKLLAKVEELTLHMIEADRDIQMLKEQNRTLQEQALGRQPAMVNSQSQTSTK